MKKIIKEPVYQDLISFLKHKFPSLVDSDMIDTEKLLSFIGKGKTSTNKFELRWLDKYETLSKIQDPPIKTLRSGLKQNSTNYYLEGDNYEILKLLSKTFSSKIDFIYIDPPYNTGSDFIYNDDFSQNKSSYLLDSNQLTKSNSESNGRFHTNWLKMIYPRLFLARNLLSEYGSIAISIDENEVANLILICDEIFGSSNRLNTMIWLKGNAQNDSKYIQKNHEYIVIYSFNKNELDITKNSIKEVTCEDSNSYYFIGSQITTGGEGGILNKRPHLGYSIYYNQETSELIPLDDYDHDLAKKFNDEKQIYSNNQDLINKGFVVIRPPKKGNLLGAWTWSLKKFNEEIKSIKIVKTGKNFSVKKKVYVDSSLVYKEEGKFYTKLQLKSPPKSYIEISSNLGTSELNDLLGNKIFNNPKPVELIKYLLGFFTNENSTVLDFFSGSGTTAHAVMKLNAEDGGNRKFIMVQLPEKTEEDSEAYKAGYKNICEIGKERIRRAGEKVKQEMLEKDASADVSKLDVGFKVFKLDSTNIKPWDGTQDINQMLIEASGNVVKTDRTDLDVVHELMLMYGVFNEEVEEIKINGKTLYSIGEHFLVVCLFKSITKQDIEAIIKLKPKNVIFNDAGFENDNVKINAELTLKNQGVEDIKSL
jgi:adenine-specific DNA-methyltransferase